MPDEDRDFLHALAEELRTQDNACTAYPLFVVQQLRRIDGMDPQIDDLDFAWHSDDHEYRYSDDEIQEVIREEIARRDRVDLASVEVLERDPEDYGWEKVCYIEIWEYVSAHLTSKAAQRFIEENAHRLTNPRVYVESQYRCHEFNRLMEILRRG